MNSVESRKTISTVWLILVQGAKEDSVQFAAPNQDNMSMHAIYTFGKIGSQRQPVVLGNDEFRTTNIRGTELRNHGPSARSGNQFL